MGDCSNSPVGFQSKMFTPGVQDGDRAIIFIVLHLVDILIAILDRFFLKWLLARLWSRCH